MAAVGAASPATEENKSMYFGLEVSAGGGAATAVYVNGVPFASKPAGDTGVQSLAIHGLVVPGRNRIDLLVGTAEVAPTSATQARVHTVPAEFFARLRLQVDSVTVEGNRIESEVRTLEQHDWEPTQIPEEGLPVPHRMTIEFDAARDQSEPVWLRAQPIRVEQVEPAVRAALSRLAAFLAQRDVERFADAMTYRYRDAARAYPLGGDERRRRASDVDELRYLLAAPDARIVPLETFELQCRVYAAGRLAECVAEDGESPLRIVTPREDKPIYLPVMFSVIGGKLAAVR
jgi:hypothetical protein